MEAEPRAVAKQKEEEQKQRKKKTTQIHKVTTDAQRALETEIESQGARGRIRKWGSGA